MACPTSTPHPFSGTGSGRPPSPVPENITMKTIIYCIQRSDWPSPQSINYKYGKHNGGNPFATAIAGDRIMARMHARRKGRARSNRPYLTENPKWVQPSAKEIENLVAQLGKDGHSTSLIGMKLRDQHGVPSVKLATKKSILQILKDNGTTFALPEDLTSLMKKAVSLQAHLQENPKDLHNKRGLNLLDAKIRRLVRYYKDNGVLPDDWIYSLKTARLQVE